MRAVLLVSPSTLKFDQNPDSIVGNDILPTCMIARLLASSWSSACLATVLLVACFGLSVSVQAQTFQCFNVTGVPPTARADGFAELLGDLVIDCTGGIPTPPNQAVPSVNIAVNLDTFMTSKVTS